jgi:flagellar hook-length control protein FliK
MAAAIAQSSGPPTDSSLPVDGFQVPNAGIASRGAAGANAAAGSAPAAAPASPSPAGATSAAVTAATAASIAQAVSDEKHSHGGGPDSSLSGTSNDGTAGAAQLLSTSSASTDASSMPTLKVSPGVDTAEFGQGVADRVSVMMDSNLTSAKLQVNPPSLGPIEVRIALQAGHAQVWFTSHSAVTRDALESTTPKLREMLGEQGFAQVSVDISQRSFQERTPQPKGYEAVPGIGSDSTAAVQSTVVARPVNGLLDAYA